MSYRLKTLWARAAARLRPAALGALLLLVGIASGGCNESESPTEPKLVPQLGQSLSASASSLPAEGTEVEIGVGDALVDPADVVLELSYTPAPATTVTPIRIRIKATRKDSGKRVAGRLKVEFGDGRMTAVKDFDGRAEVEHTYKEVSVFELTATVTEAKGVATSKVFRIKIIGEVRTTLSLSADATEVPAREPAGFKVEVGRSDGTRSSGLVTIDWGDGRSTTLAAIGKSRTEHTYREPGSYKVLAEVVDEGGRSVKNAVRVRVLDRIRVSSTLSADSTTPGVEQTVAYTFTVTRSDGKPASGTAAVTFGDGATASVTVSKSTAGFEHAFAAEDTYTTSVIFDDGSSRTVTASVRIDVSAESSGDAIDANSLKWLHPNASDWEISSTVTSVSVTSSLICIRHTKAGGWPVRDGLEGNPWIVAQVGGTWYAANYEWLRSGQVCKGLGVPSDYPNIAKALGPHIKIPPLSSWVPKSGETVYLFVTTLARAGVRSSDERSNIVKVIWP